ncbi:MAG: hypothetical protein HYY86_01425 [Candidatus Harrisonbacteria bacterium]|nr:hypothetical protein [Candidatus Harrisonbacteria bacterium]
MSNSKPSKQILNLIKKVVVLNADQFFPIKILIGNVLMFKVNKYDSEAPPIVYIKVLNTKRLARFYKIIMKEISKIIPTISDPKEVMNFHITIGFLKSRKFINLIIKTIQKFKKDKSIFINLDKIQLRLSSKERILLKSYK